MIEVILREDIKTLGRAGEMVRVKPGYARNYLLPQGLAFEATEGNKKRIAAESKARASRDQAEKAEAQKVAATLGDVTLNLSGKAGEEGKLFGSITSADIADRLNEHGLDYTIDKRDIELDEAIKALGDYTVTIRLHTEVKPQIKVSVTAQD
ncbi:MAG TPA: 50S ribosomal protein L9 [Gemmatimonadales bacterium]